MAIRSVAVVLAVPALFRLLLPWWTSLETATVGFVLEALGVDVSRTGRELLLRHGGEPVVLVVVGWCSSLGAVLGLVGLAWVLPGAFGDRRRALAGALAIVLIGNIVRLTAVGWVAATWAPSSVDAFHDGPATAFAVVVVLLAVAVVALGDPWRRHGAPR